MKRGDIQARADVNYAAGASQFARIYAHPRFPLVPLEDCIELLQYGSSGLANTRGEGLPMVRMNNLQANGWDFSDVKHIALSEKEAEAYRLEPGDILFNRTNSKELVGKCEVFREAGHWVYASYLIRMRLDTDKALPDFVSTFLNTPAGRVQLDRVSRQIVGMSNINATEIRDLVIPLPPLPKQSRFVAELDAARAERGQRLKEADRLLATLDTYLLDALGLTFSEEFQRRMFAVRWLSMAPRIDVDFNSPRFRKLRESIEASPFTAVRIGDICIEIRSGFAAGRQDQADEASGGIPHLRPLNLNASGELWLRDTKRVPASDVEERDLITQGEVLFNNTNSTEWVGKSAVFELTEPCACSNHMTRLKLKQGAEPHFIADYFNALRSIGYLGILSTNFNNQAGINTVTLADVKVPLPLLSKQQKIATEIRRRRDAARRLRAEAEADWNAAKAKFEQQLLAHAKP